MLHDLSFAFGLPPRELSQRLTEREFTRLHIDALQRPIGQRRIEILLAQLAYYLCAVNGAQDLSLSDFLKVLDPPDDDTEELDDDGPIDVAGQQAAFGFNPINLKREQIDVEHPGSPGGAAGP